MDEVTICNMALRLIGAEPILSLSGDDKEQALCSLFYDPTRDEVLSDIEWKFAIHRQSLSSVDVDDDTYPDWSYVYQLPTDPYCLRPIEIVNQPTEKWTIEGDHFLTNATDVYLKYIKRIDDPTEFDSLFVKALTYRLAFDLAYSETGVQRTDLYMMYTQQLNRARAKNLVSGSNKQIKRQSWGEVRFS